jgi:hypothetical protein
MPEPFFMPLLSRLWTRSLGPSSRADGFFQETIGGRDNGQLLSGESILCDRYLSGGNLMVIARFATLSLAVGGVCGLIQESARFVEVAVSRQNRISNRGTSAEEQHTDGNKPQDFLHTEPFAILILF